MATVPSPRTWTVGELLTAAKLNTDVRDAINFLLARPFAILGKSANQNIAASAMVTWDTEFIDRDGGHSNVTNNTRYTAQTAGWYQVVACLGWTAGSGILQANLYKNGLITSPLIQDFTVPNVASAVITAVGFVFLSVAEYIEVQGFNGGGSRDVVAHTGNAATRFSVEWATTA